MADDTVAITYRGVMRSGAHSMGRVVDVDVPTFVQRKYRANWTALEVHQDGHLVGGIEDSPDRSWPHKARRMWWAEATS